MSRLHRLATLPGALSAIFAITLLAGLLSPGLASAETMFTITGHGYGHGIGMSQYGACSLAARGWSYSDILCHYYQGTTVGSLGYTAGSNAETVMRVALEKSDVSDAWWTVRANEGELWISWDGMREGQYLKIPCGLSYTFFVENGQINGRDQNRDRWQVFTGASWVQVWERDTSQPHGSGLVQVIDPSGPFSRSNILYPGSIRFDRSTVSASLYARNYVYMEDYVRCVVPRESPASWPVESLKAQAVAARSYAYISRKPSSSYDVYCTTSSQVYNGWGAWTAAGGNERHSDDSDVDPAVAATSAQVVKHGSSVIQTFFFSTSGGYTESISNVWPGATQQPYYTAVPDPWEHEAGSSRHSWGPYVYSATQVRDKLIAAGIPSTRLPTIITQMKVLKRGISGRVMELQIVGLGGSYTLSGSTDMNRVRNALCMSKDTWFYVDAITGRVSGDSRYETAVEFSQSFSSSSSVVIANGARYADALTASGLAGALDAPILLTRTDAVPDEVLAEIKRLGATRVYVVGGPTVVGAGAIADLAGLPSVGSAGVERIYGSDRYETGLRIAERIKQIKGASYSGTAIVVSGERLADAMAAAPWAYRADTAVILVRADGVPSFSKEAVTAVGATWAQVVGGTSVIPDAVKASLGVTCKRVAGGADRYETASQLAEYIVSFAGFKWDTVHVASGESLVDALAGSSFAARNSGPMLFARQYSLPSTSSGQLTAHKTAVDAVWMLGGPTALNNVVEADIERSRE
ncbi:MAG: cell wall-binding repeat-containing protein [Coriobacteriia bacterium]|nr:cell wall-binding repeat-containing protein [Coriobacteriia bacterium]